MTKPMDEMDVISSPFLHAGQLRGFSGCRSQSMSASDGFAAVAFSASAPTAADASMSVAMSFVVSTSVSVVSPTGGCSGGTSLSAAASPTAVMLGDVLAAKRTALGVVESIRWSCALKKSEEIF